MENILINEWTQEASLDTLHSLYILLKRFSVGSTPWTYNCNISPEWSVYNIGVKVMSRFQICMILKLEHQL